MRYERLTSYQMSVSRLEALPGGASNPSIPPRRKAQKGHGPQCIHIWYGLLMELVITYNNWPLTIRAVAGQRSSPDLCFATTSVRNYDP